MSHVRQEMTAFFERWKDSGVGVRQFGEQEGVSYAKIQYWRRRLSLSTRERSSKSKQAVLPVRIVEEKETPLAAFEVMLANGLSCRVPQGWSEIELRRLIETLRSC